MQYKPTGEPTTRVMVTFEVADVPDWTPPHKSRTIVPERLRVVWEDGKPYQAGVFGRFRLKSGNLGDDTSSGYRCHYDDFQDGIDIITSAIVRRDDTLPEWAWELIEAETEHRQSNPARRDGWCD